MRNRTTAFNACNSSLAAGFARLLQWSHPLHPARSRQAYIKKSKTSIPKCGLPSAAQLAAVPCPACKYNASVDNMPQTGLCRLDTRDIYRIRYKKVFS
jgi:hypothetical protein